MNRRVFLALLPLPWLVDVERWATERNVRRACRAIWSGPEPTGLSFVARKPEGVLLLRENMRIDWYFDRWPHMVPRTQTQRITAIDHDKRIVTYG